MRICPSCSRMAQGDCDCPGSAATRQRAEERRLVRRRRDGRNLGAWQRTRHAVLARDEHTCTYCGDPANSVHSLDGGYHHADPDAYRAACVPCHGRLDGAGRKATA